MSNTKTDVNRRVLAIQAKKKRHKPGKRKGKGGGTGGTATTVTSNSQGETEVSSTSQQEIRGQQNKAENNSAKSNIKSPNKVM